MKREKEGREWVACKTGHFDLELKELHTWWGSHQPHTHLPLLLTFKADEQYLSVFLVIYLTTLNVFS